MNMDVTNIFIANTRAKSGEVNQNFNDVIGFLASHHHDPNIYTNAVPITNSGIAANAQILATQLKYPITLSGLVNYQSLDNVPVAKGGTGLAKVNAYDLIVGGVGNTMQRIALGSANKVIGVDPTGSFLDFVSIPDSSVFATVAGAAITAGQPVHISPYIQIDGGIVLDNQQSYGIAPTQSFTVGSGSNRALAVGVSSSTAPSGVTYAGVAMTLVDSQSISSGFTLYVYKLIAPTSGANNIVVSGGTIVHISAASWSGVHQTTFIDVTAKATAASSSVGQSITTLLGGACVHQFTGAYSQGNVGSLDGSTTSTSKYSSSFSVTTTSNVDVTQGGTASSDIGKVNEAQTIAVTSSIANTNSTVGTAIILISLAPATALSGGVLPTSSSIAKMNEPLIQFVGFATSTVAVGATFNVQLSSVVSGLSGLVAGQIYYLQDSTGTIGLTRGTYGKIVGKALSATTLLIGSEKTMGSAISKSVSYTYTAETDGFIYANCIGNGVTVTITTSDANQTVLAIGASENIIATLPVSKGKTYSISASGSSVIFIPFA